jgi:hypothetical protein
LLISLLNPKRIADARISCTWHQATAAYAAFIEESRMKFISANKLPSKSGMPGWGGVDARAGA